MQVAVGRMGDSELRALNELVCDLGIMRSKWSSSSLRDCIQLDLEERVVIKI